MAQKFAKRKYKNKNWCACRRITGYMLYKVNKNIEDFSSQNHLEANTRSSCFCKSLDSKNKRRHF
jgi:hypothetical protein